MSANPFDELFEPAPTFRAPTFTSPSDDVLDDLFDAPVAEPAQELAAPAPEPETDPHPAAFAPGGKATAMLAELDALGAQFAQTTAAAVPARTPVQMYVTEQRLWPVVDRVLSLVPEYTELQGLVQGLRLTRDPDVDAAQRRDLERAFTPYISRANIPIPTGDAATVLQMLHDELVGISVLGGPWRDDEVTEIMVDGWDTVIVERNGQLYDTTLSFRNRQHSERVARELAQRVANRQVSPTNPLVSAELPGARVAFAYGAVTRSGVSITIRKFRPLLGIEALMGFNAMSDEMREFLADCVAARATVLVSGGTGTGKTTIINALSQFIPDSERVITVEDAFELQLSNRHWLALQTKEKASADDTVSVTMADLLKATLRMRPDRIIVGECRDANAASVMLAAANTGHDGTMTTVHANDVGTALNYRMAGFLRSGESIPDDVAKETVALALDLVIQVTRRAGRRYISEIATVDVTDLADGKLHPQCVFGGDLDSALQPSFTRDGRVNPDSKLGRKLADAGITRWFPTGPTT
jgi:pilus assembly protein CpaF